MRSKILIAILFILALSSIFIRQQFAYPKVWDEIHIGMTWQEVTDLVGEPKPYMDEKGPYWNESKLTQSQKLWIYFSEGRVVMMSIKRHFGIDHNQFTQTARYESTHEQ